MNPVLFASLMISADHLARRGVYPPNDAWLTETAKSQQYYELTLMQTVKDRMENKTDDIAFLAVMGVLIASQLRRAYREGLQEAGYTGGLDNEMENELARAEMEEEKHTRALLAAILLAMLAGLTWESMRWRMALWANRYEDMRTRGAIVGAKRSGILLEWVLGATEKHCIDCATYSGQVKTGQEWDDIYRTLGHRPQSRDLQCGGWRCDCRLERAK